MGNGVFGTVRPADIDIVSDVEVMYMYRPTRSADEDGVRGYRPMDPSSCLVHSINDEDTTKIAGLYELRLPLDIFNRKGFYSVYIRIRGQHTDVQQSALQLYIHIIPPFTRYILLRYTSLCARHRITRY